MSSIVTSILCSTVGLLWNKARDTTAAKLKDGDVTDSKVREIVVRELSEIKTKLDGLSRKDLLSSYSFLQEGVDFLNASVDKSRLGQKSLTNATEDDRGKSSRLSSGVESGMLDEVLQLSQAMEKLKMNSNKEFELAIERFKDARKRATDAFCIESLGIEDRIMAAKLRVVSEMLESLETPETAITGCLSFLKKLHGLPAVQEIFNVYLRSKGIKSKLNKAERVENVKSLMMINYVLFQYVSKFGSTKYSFVLSWPTIQFGDRRFHPILNWRSVSTRRSMGEGLPPQPNGLQLLDEVIFPQYSAVNSYWDVAIAYCDSIKVRSNTGEVKVVKLPEPKHGEGIDQDIEAIAIDKNNHVYVVRSVKTRKNKDDVKLSYVLNVLDEKYDAIQEECMLDFVEKRFFDMIRIAVNTDNNITMIIDNDPHVYVCDNNGQLQNKFACDSGLLTSLGISERNEIVRSSRYLNAVHIYSEEGDLKSTLKLPEDHRIRGVAFHHFIRKILVLTFVEEKYSCFLLCYTEAGELEKTTFLYKYNGNEYYPKITSHPDGPVAIVGEQSIMFI
jgi:hypothetical protein